MTMQTYPAVPQRIGRFLGRTFKHAVPREVLAKTGRQEVLPPNHGDTYVGRRFLPYGATNADANSMNRFFQNGAGDRGLNMVQAHLTQEGVTPLPDSIQAVDTTVVMQQYSCLYGYTDKVALLYEDNIPDEMAKQVGERVTTVNEQVVFGALRGATNQFFGGSGTSRATVNGTLTLGMLRKIARNLEANHATKPNRMLSASNRYNTDAVEESFFVYCHSDLAPDIRDLPGFVPAVNYASGTPLPREMGKCEDFRFITSPDFPALLDQGASVAAAPGLQSQSGSNIDVYQFIVTGEDAWSQIAVRGPGALKVVDLPAGKSEKADIFGQRGYVGAIWWKAVMVENNGWMAVGNVGVKNLTN